MTSALDRLRGIFDARPRAGRLAPLRERGMACFAARGLPTPREEDWRYTSLEPLARLPLRDPSPGALSADRFRRLPFAGLEGPRLVLVDGSLSRELSVLPEGPVRFSTLAEAARRGEAAVEAHLARYARVEDRPMDALNAALFADGILLHVPEGASMEAPLHLLHVSSGEEGAVSHPRVLLLAGPRSRLKVTELFLGSGGASVTNAVTELVAMEGASVEHLKVQLEPESSLHVGTLRVHQDAGSSVASSTISIGAALSRSEVHVDLDGEGASCRLSGLALAAGSQHADLLTSVDHLSPGCRSDQLFKAALAGRGRGVFLGRVRVRPGAVRTEAHQVNRNLLLSEEAEADARPHLRIDADDVVCTHGATVGQLDPQQVFYLRSRGLSTEASRSLLTHAFAHEVLDALPEAGVREALSAVFCAWLTRTLGSGVHL